MMARKAKAKERKKERKSANGHGVGGWSLDRGVPPRLGPVDGGLGQSGCVHLSCQLVGSTFHFFPSLQTRSLALSLYLSASTSVSVSRPSYLFRLVRGLMAPVEEGLVPPFTTDWYIYAGSALFCICGAAMAAGLTMGLVALDLDSLNQILMTEPGDCDTKEERVQLLRMQGYARRIVPVKKNHHLLLVTLLLINSGVNEALPIFLDSIVPSWLAIVLSVSLVLLFGEILPSAVFTGPSQLKIASSFATLVWCLIIVLYPIAFPISKFLDCCLGKEGHLGRHKRAELKGLLRVANGAIERKRNAENAIMDFGLDEEQIEIMQGALDLKTVKVQDVMVPLDKAFMLPLEGRLDEKTMVEILATGHSRILVYSVNPHNVCGLLLVKRLITLNPADATPIKQICARKPVVIGGDRPLLEALQEFSHGRSHLALVTSSVDSVKRCFSTGKTIPANVHMMGIITMEDIFENIMQKSISDECDNLGRQMSGEIVDEKTKQRIARLKALAAAMKKEDALNAQANGDRRAVKSVSSRNAAGGNKIASATIDTPLLSAFDSSTSMDEHV